MKSLSQPIGQSAHMLAGQIDGFGVGWLIVWVGGSVDRPNIKTQALGLDTLQVCPEFIKRSN